jgi:hypothetical protein
MISALMNMWRGNRGAFRLAAGDSSCAAKDGHSVTISRRQPKMPSPDFL